MEEVSLAMMHNFDESNTEDESVILRVGLRTTRCLKGLIMGILVEIRPGCTSKQRKLISNTAAN
jgi:hypothetical protein